MRLRLDHNLTISFATPLQVQMLPPPVVAKDYRAIFTFTMGQFVFKGENMANTMQSGSIATLSIQWSDSHGNPAKVDGPTQWVSSDEDVLTVQVAAGNPLIANVYSQGPVGPAQIQATADADLGEGVKTITAVCDINVIAGEASGGTITFTQSPPQAGAGQTRGGARK